MSSVPARRHLAPATLPGPGRVTPGRRPRHLHAVDDTPAPRRLSSRVLGTLVVSMVFVALFGLAAFHVVLVQGQQRLDALGERVDVAQATYEANRLEAAQLESPSRVVEAALDSGMVPAPDVTYLTPERVIDPAAPPGSASAEPPAPGVAEQAAEAGAGWATVKPYLDGGT